MYKCPVCDETFSFGGSYYLHLNRHKESAAASDALPPARQSLPSPASRRVKIAIDKSVVSRYVAEKEAVLRAVDAGEIRKTARNLEGIGLRYLAVEGKNCVLLFAPYRNPAGDFRFIISSLVGGEPCYRKPVS